MDLQQISMVIAGLIGFLLARWNYKREAEFARKKQAVYGVHYAKALAPRMLEDWEIEIISDRQFKSNADYLSAKHDSILYGMPELTPPKTEADKGRDIP